MNGALALFHGVHISADMSKAVAFRRFISCKVGIDWFKAHNQWKGRSYTPKSGDYIFFDWEPDGVADHIGIVDYYENGYVYTVEGNSSDTCRTKSYSIDDSCIYGFAVPNFKK